MDVTGTNTAVQTVTVKPNLNAFADLMSEDAVIMHEVYLPGGELIDLQLKRLDLDLMKMNFFVDGAPRADLLDNLDLSVWQGTVVGETDSDVTLSFSRAGSRGWIKRGNEVLHLMPMAGENDDWLSSTAMMVSETTLNDLGSEMGNFCENEKTDGQMLGERLLRTPVGNPLLDQDAESLGFQFAQGACNLRECTVAIETDYQLNQVFNGNLSAETAYVTSLIAAGSGRYIDQFNTVLTFPYVQFYTTSNDGWSAQDSGGNSIDVLNEFVATWAGNIPTGARLGHFLSGAGLGGGVAYLDVLCNNDFNFGVSGNINGNMPFPVVSGPLTWDFMVFTHELGHNFSSPHSHDYCPPLDQCPSSQYWGQCQNAQVCTNQGTIMSYCHLCSGGLNNMTLFFHPTVIAQVLPATVACLPIYSGATGTPPTLVSAITPTEVSVEVVGNLNGNVLLNYRYNGGSYASIVMNNSSGSTYVADLPVTICTDTPEFYVSFNSDSCGPATVPVGGASSPWTAIPGDPVVGFSDNFEAAMGWTTSVQGASSGQWQRGVPVNANDWDYDPSSDGDGSGSAYLTQNETGNTDVDGGSVTLVSPILDMTGGDVIVEYLYYLWLSNTDGDDLILVEANNNGGVGSWTEIARHDTQGGDSWKSNAIDMNSTGITLTSTMVLRFTANDADAQSIVEAGIDGFKVIEVVCGSGPTGPTSYCDPANPNSVDGFGALLTHLSGDPGQVMSFNISGIPATPGILFFGDTQGDLPFGCGRRCVLGQVTRSSVYNGSTGGIVAVFDTTGINSSPFNIQYWFRDTADIFCSDGFNTSNAIGW